MVFSSLAFLFIFLPLLAVLFFITPARLKNTRQYILLGASLLFYGAGEPRYIFLILTCISLSWVLSRYVETHRKWALVLSILINVIPLIVTKYFGFLMLNSCRLFHVTDVRVPNIVMPIGISFYTFQVITYISDLYNGKIKRQKDPMLFALYIMFFPQLIAGPIVKYSEIEEQLRDPDVNWERVQYGVGRFITGLGKKVLIANQAGYIASSIFDGGISSLSPGMAWLCVIAYSVQIYFDFSGYSEMAIGLGSIFGFHFPENFNDPYTSTSVSDFWRRWHITLGRFFREYVYIPLGGNRVSKGRWIFNIFVVWALTGLWHGASWNFVLWGLYYGILIVIDRVTGISRRLPKVLSWGLTLFLVMVGWGIFICDGITVSQTGRFIGKLFFIGGEVTDPVTVGSLRLWGYIPFLIIGLFVTTPLWVSVIRTKIAALSVKYNIIYDVITDLFMILILVASLVFLIGGTYNPFIYFRF